METVLLAEFPSSEEARIAHGMLLAHGIDAQVRLEDAGGAYPQLASRVQGGTGVHVPADQLDQARELLDAVRERQQAAADCPDETARRRTWPSAKRRRWGRILITAAAASPLVLAILLDWLGPGLVMP